LRFHIERRDLTAAAAAAVEEEVEEDIVHQSNEVFFLPFDSYFVLSEPVDDG
jgi:hypothetical protein